jgi:hypothetical protein
MASCMLITVAVSTPFTKSQYVLFTFAAACTSKPNATALSASILSHSSPDLPCPCMWSGIDRAT